MKEIFRKFKDAAGKDAFEKYTVDGIDAIEAVDRHPKEYSYKPWPGQRDENTDDRSPPVIEVKAELLPEQPVTGRS